MAAAAMMMPSLIMRSSLSWLPNKPFDDANSFLTGIAQMIPPNHRRRQPGSHSAAPSGPTISLETNARHPVASLEGRVMTSPLVRRVVISPGVRKRSAVACRQAQAQAQHPGAFIDLGAYSLCICLQTQPSIPKDKPPHLTAKNHHSLTNSSRPGDAKNAMMYERHAGSGLRADR